MIETITRAYSALVKRETNATADNTRQGASQREILSQLEGYLHDSRSCGISVFFSFLHYSHSRNFSVQEDLQKGSPRRRSYDVSVRDGYFPMRMKNRDDRAIIVCDSREELVARSYRVREHASSSGSFRTYIRFFE